MQHAPGWVEPEVKDPNPGFSTPNEKRPLPTPSTSSSALVMRMKSSKVGEDMVEDVPSCGPLTLFVQNQLDEVRDSPEKVAIGKKLRVSPQRSLGALGNLVRSDEFLGLFENKEKTDEFLGLFENDDQPWEEEIDMRDNVHSSMACPANPPEEDPQVGLPENAFEWGEQAPLSRDEVFGSMSNLYNSFKTLVEGMMEELRLLHRSGSETSANNGLLFSKMA